MASVKLSTKAVGSTVKLKVNGAYRDFIVVHQGLPGSMYDTSCNGTWLLMKDIYELRQWHSVNGTTTPDYSGSDVNTYLNDTLPSLFDSDILAQIKWVRLPYKAGVRTNSVIKDGVNGMLCRFFLLSMLEVGFIPGVHISASRTMVDGEKLDYFLSGPAETPVQSEVNIRRKAIFNGDYTRWMTRTQDKIGYDPWVVSASGSSSITASRTEYFGLRPALILPGTMSVSDDGTVVANAAPTAPASIDVPAGIEGGSSVTVSWAAGSDPDGNLEGYKLERSTDGGDTWTQVYQGAGTSAVCAVAFGTETVMFRVRAYDSQGEHSGWRTSGQVTVINNTAPGDPSSITVPLLVLGGGPLTVAWGPAQDVDDDLAGYALERQADGGTWTEVYRGEALSFTDTITRGWATVAYRVRAYDGHGAYSGYTASTAREVNNNTAPVIQCEQESGADLGTVSEGFSIDYSASDADGDAVAITEAVDGRPMRQFTAGAGQTYTAAVTGETFMKLLNGAHTLTVTASDGKAEAVHPLTFTKLVTAAGVTLAQPMEADAPITICVLSVTGHIPEDAAYHVKVTNNANDEDPVWEDCTAEVKNGGNHIFANETAVNGFAFNFKVTAERGESGEGGCINSVQGGFQ